MRNPCLEYNYYTLFIFERYVFFILNFPLFPPSFFPTLGQAQARDGEQQYSDQNVGEWHTERERERQRET